MLVPAIHFPGNCSQAIKLYQKVLNAQVIHITYYSDAPPDSDLAATEATRDQIMHAELSIGGTRVNMADVPGEVLPGSMFLFNIFLDAQEEVAAAFHALKEGGQVLTDLGPQFWTPLYGDLIDRFGVHWQLMANS